MLSVVIRRAAIGSPVFTAVTPLQPEQSVFRFKDFERPLYSSLPRKLRFPHVVHELFQQLRTSLVPGKTHLASDSEYAGLQAVAVYGTGSNIRGWLVGRGALHYRPVWG